MNRVFEDGIKFEYEDYRVNPLSKGDYESCVFTDCNFSESDLSDINFIDCEFISCNLSLAKLYRSSLRDIKFRSSKLMGVHFSDCNELLFSVSFEGCLLDLVSFYKVKLKGTRFKDSKFSEADFTEADISNSAFINCDLGGAFFFHTNMEQADFRTASNYIIDPEVNRIKGAKFSISGISGLLSKYDIDIENS